MFKIYELVYLTQIFFYRKWVIYTSTFLKMVTELATSGDNAIFRSDVYDELENLNINNIIVMLLFIQLSSTQK